MHTINTLTRTGRENVTVYDIYDFPYKQPYKVNKSKHYSYISHPATFDIECSRFISGYDEKGEPIWKSTMYHWQFCMCGNVCFGRTWDEYQIFKSRLAYEYKLNDTQKLIVFVHNLGYEFQHLLWYEKWSDVFANGRRNIITARTDIFEYRCSYKLSNMSLEKFCENSTKCIHIKAKGDLDYSVFRSSSTPLTNEEEGYCYNDVRGLEECVREYIEHERSIAQLPLTSTGFPRRDCRTAMRKKRSNRKWFNSSRMTLEEYHLALDCFRGGNTGSNRHRTGTIEFDVNSKDIASSYPGQMLKELYPSGRWRMYKPRSIIDVVDYCERYATMAYYYFEDIWTNEAIPFIPRAKCKQVEEYVNCNGRILKAKSLIIALTDVDFLIVKNTYHFSRMKVHGFRWCIKERLPKELLDTLWSYYEKKSILKGVKGMEYEYLLGKARLNSLYGLTASKSIHTNWSVDEEGNWIESSIDEEEELNKYYNSDNSFLPYQIGVWVAAYGRKQLQRMLDIVGDDVVYCDTDSVKYVNDHESDFKKENEKIMKQYEELGITQYVVVNGKKKFISIWDDDGEYDRFTTLGAKKYCYEKDGATHITVAGLSKELGSNELQRTGGIEEFRIGKVFFDSGRTIAHYHNDKPHYEEVNGERVEVASGVAITDTTYTLGVTDEYYGIISQFWDEYIK